MKRYLIFLMMLALPNFLAAQMYISLPIGGVYQTTGSTTPVALAGQYVGTSLANYRIEYNVLRLNVSDGSYHSTYQNYTTIVTNPTYGLFKTTIYLPVGWYTVNVRVYNIATSSAGSSNAIKFGVGDVYVIAGQSNAQGNPPNGSSWSLPSLSTYDGVVSHNAWEPCNDSLPPYPVMSPLSGYNRIAPSGNNSWCWAKLGQDLQSGSPSGGLPIAFFNAAASGSTSNNWKRSAAGDTTANIYTGVVWCDTTYTGAAQPYFDFKTTLKYYASVFGAKAVLWHQGESDNDLTTTPISATSRTDYKDRIDYVIDQSRADFSSSLRWLVSEVSFNGKNPPGSTTRSDVTSAQNDLTISPIDGSNGSSSDYSYTGVITDPLGYAYRDATDLVHFREDRSSALSTIGGYWNTKIGAATNGYTQLGAFLPPLVTMSKSGSNWTLTVSGTYSEYRWLNMANPKPNSDFLVLGTNYNLSGSTGGSYACLVKDGSGKWTITQTIYTNCGSCREGVAELEEWHEEELGLSTKAYPVPFDKEFTIEFTIPNQSMVKLELINMNGEVISKITDNIHARGTYKYPVQTPGLSAGMIFYRLNVNGLAITKKLVKSN